MPSSERLLSGRRLRQKQLVKSFGTKRSFLVAAVATDDKPEHSNNARPSFLQSLLGFSAKKEKDEGDSSLLKSIPEHWRTHLEALPKKREQRKLQRHMRTVCQIISLEPDMMALSNDDLAAKTGEFRERLRNGKTLDDILPEAFAVVREASRRVLSMRHYDVQLIGGMVLHEGQIAEMQTGEGKTLVATLPAYLNALEGKGVHLITVNDYLAKRDCEWMGKLYEFLGLSVAVVQEGYSQIRKREAFNADITYLTANQLGFTYLADTSSVDNKNNLAILRPFHYAIVDEADSLLIDDCRNALIISTSPDSASKGRFELAHEIINRTTSDGILKMSEQRMDPQTGHTFYIQRNPQTGMEMKRGGEGHYIVEPQLHRVSLTEKGMEAVLDAMVESKQPFARAEAEGGIPSTTDLWDDDHPIGPYIVNALRARELYKRDVNYIVRDGEIKIVNCSTGRVMPISRWTDDLHQAVEAQEPNVRVKGRSKVAASITFQTLFKYYSKLAGMTGTAATEEEEFYEVYGLNVAVVPPHKPRQRVDRIPRVYVDEERLEEQIRRLVVSAHSQQRPVLIGTASVAESEKIAATMTSWGLNLPFQMLNARPQYIKKEAKIIAQAGVPGMITIATNMAGRGTDIILGGNPRGLAELALENSILPILLGKEDLKTELQAMPESFGGSRFRDSLPPELAGTLARAEAVVAVRYISGLPTYEVVEKMIGKALSQAEPIYQQVMAGRMPSPRSTLRFEELLPSLKRQCEEKLGRFEAGSDAELIGELTRALLYLWLYFEEECAKRASMVRRVRGLLVMVLSMQESERAAIQLKGRAGRQGDPGDTVTLVSFKDPCVVQAGLSEGMIAVQPWLQKLDRSAGYMDEAVGQWYMRHVQGKLKEGKRSVRQTLAQNDKIIEVFRQHKDGLRMQLLLGDAEERASILRVAFLGAAEWLVTANVDPSHPPTDAERWNLKKLVNQVRYLVNPAQKLVWKTPRKRFVIDVYKKVIGSSHYVIPIEDAEDVMGPMDDHNCAEMLRSYLAGKNPAAELATLAVPHVPRALKEDFDFLQKARKERALLEGSAFQGEWAAAADALVGHIAAAITIAYEEGRAPKIRIAMQEYVDTWQRAVARGDGRGFNPGSVDVLFERFERETLIQVLDNLWGDFLEDLKTVDTAVMLRAFSHLDPLDELRLEGGDLFLKSLKRLRQQWARKLLLGPQLVIDLDVLKDELDANGGEGEPVLDLEIGPPITDLSEGMAPAAAEEATEVTGPTNGLAAAGDAPRGAAESDSGLGMPLNGASAKSAGAAHNGAQSKPLLSEEDSYHASRQDMSRR